VCSFLKGCSNTQHHKIIHQIQEMKTKKEIVEDWIYRYTDTKMEEFGEYILLTNFKNYMEIFAKKYGTVVKGRNRPMQTATSDNITLINFGMGSPLAATVMDLLSAIKPKAVLFLGKCGGLKSKTKVGDFVLPIAAIRGEGTSNDYVPPEVPALPSFSIHRHVSYAIVDHGHEYWTGTVYTTNRRVWEHDRKFKKYLKNIKALAIDMETATVFSVGFANRIPRGAILLISDVPMDPEGVKTSSSDKSVTANFVEPHIEIGVESLKRIANSGASVRHLRYE